jgi:hypothetical protein
LPLACKVNQKIPNYEKNVTFLPFLIKNIRDFAISTCYLSSKYEENDFNFYVGML